MMDWLIILITSFIISAILFFIVFLRNNNDPGSILIKNVVKLNALLNYNIFVKEEIYLSGEGYAKRIRFELTKNRLVHKIENVRKIICNLINVYDVDIKIENFYNKQIQSFEIISEDIFSKLTSLSEDMKYDNFILSARGQVVFNALNEKINKFITQFLLGNSKFFKKLKFQYKNKKESISSNETDIEMIFRKRKRIKSFLIFIATTILSFGIGLLVNFISKLLGI